LFCIADVLGGEWSRRVRDVADAAESVRNEQSVRALLLGDIRSAFEAKRVDRLSSEDLTAYLTGLEGRSWGAWKSGKSLTKSGLARLLKPFAIVSGIHPD
jgi:hypothetical protein